LNSEGTAQLAETKNRIRKAGRKLMSDMQKLKASRDSAKQVRIQGLGFGSENAKALPSSVLAPPPCF
jgi:hypothetical protein